MLKEKKSPKLELLILKGSPYSRRVKWALELLKVEYTQLKHEVIVGEISLRWRLGRLNPWATTTVPVGFACLDNGKPELQLGDGLAIVEWADDLAASNSSKIPRLVPSESRRKIVNYCSMVDAIQDFERCMFLKASWEDPTLLRVFIGQDPPDAALHEISFVSGTFISCKYRSTLKATTPEIRHIPSELEETVAAKQKNQPKDSMVYLVGNSLTLADIYLSIALCGGPKVESDDNNGLGLKVNKAIAKLSFGTKKEYPTLTEWAKGISKQHGVPAEFTR